MERLESLTYEACIFRILCYAFTSASIFVTDIGIRSTSRHSHRTARRPNGFGGIYRHLYHDRHQN